jgi:hypothetical protein
MPNTYTYFTENFFNYLATSFGTMIERIALVKNDDDIILENDLVISGSDAELINNTEKEITVTTDNNIFECTAKIKKAKKGWKNKTPVFFGSLTALLNYSLIDSINNDSDLLFANGNPTKDLFETVFYSVFNTCTDYKIYAFSGTPTVETAEYGTCTYGYWGSQVDFFSIATTNTDTFYPASLGSSPSTLTSFLYQSETSLMMGTFTELEMRMSGTQTINGFFVTNESIPDLLNTESPLILFGCSLEGGLSFSTKPDRENYAIITTPKISLSMDVIII